MEHINYSRQSNSEIVVKASGHDTAAFFTARTTGYNNYADSVRYAAWLRGIGYSPAIYTIAEYDALRVMGAL